jgi:hypothetical protein
MPSCEKAIHQSIVDHISINLPDRFIDLSLQRVAVGGTPINQSIVSITVIRLDFSNAYLDLCVTHNTWISK